MSYRTENLILYLSKQHDWLFIYDKTGCIDQRENGLSGLAILVYSKQIAIESVILLNLSNKQTNHIYSSWKGRRCELMESRMVYDSHDPMDMNFTIEFKNCTLQIHNTHMPRGMGRYSNPNVCTNLATVILALSENIPCIVLGEGDSFYTEGWIRDLKDQMKDKDDGRFNLTFKNQEDSKMCSSDSTSIHVIGWDDVQLLKSLRRKTFYSERLGFTNKEPEMLFCNPKDYLRGVEKEKYLCYMGMKTDNDVRNNKFLTMYS